MEKVYESISPYGLYNVFVSRETLLLVDNHYSFMHYIYEYIIRLTPPENELQYRAIRVIYDPVKKIYSTSPEYENVGFTRQGNCFVTLHEHPITFTSCDDYLNYHYGNDYWFTDFIKHFKFLLEKPKHLDAVAINPYTKKKI
jgi:hypothetical protein